MTKLMDYMISPLPIRVIDSKLDKSKLSLKSLTIIEVGHLPGRTLQRKHAKFDHWAFGYIAGGQGTYQVNEGPIQTVTKGSLFFVYPNATFHYGPEENGYWDEYYIRFEGNRIQEWLQNRLFQTDTVKLIGWYDTSLSKLEMIFKLMETGDPSNVDRTSLLLEQLLFEWILKSKESMQNTPKQNVNYLIENISKVIFQPFDAAKLAESNHISVPTLRRIVSQYTGYPLNEYIHRLKIAEAKRILLNTDWSIKD